MELFVHHTDEIGVLLSEDPLLCIRLRADECSGLLRGEKGLGDLEGERPNKEGRGQEPWGENVLAGRPLVDRQ